MPRRLNSTIAVQAEHKRQIPYGVTAVYRRAAYAGEIEHLRPQLNVTGVDNSAEMLAHVSERVRRIHSDIELLALAERFDSVLLPSGLINHADAVVRRNFVAAAARHLLPDGQLILKRQDPLWL